MSFLEIFGIIFLAVIVLNVVIGIFAVKTAAASEEEINFEYSAANKLKMMANH
jgi:hypothetical protein